MQREKDEEIQRIAVDAETKKQLSIEHAKLELERAHKEAERKRDLEHGEAATEANDGVPKDRASVDGHEIQTGTKHKIT